jgi:hypothetical protein
MEIFRSLLASSHETDFSLVLVAVEVQLFVQNQLPLM